MCDELTKILLVEDDADTAFVLSKLLEVEGFEVFRAGGVKEAYDDALATAPDLVVTDIEMPVLSGLDLIRIFKKDPALTNIPIIAVSALEEDQLRRATAAGAAAVQEKPLQYERLLSTIGRLSRATRVPPAPCLRDAARAHP